LRELTNVYDLLTTSVVQVSILVELEVYHARPIGLYELKDQISLDFPFPIGTEQ
jgi:hypothetical protein